MPFTPRHMGPGMLVNAARSKHCRMVAAVCVLLAAWGAVVPARGAVPVPFEGQSTSAPQPGPLDRRVLSRLRQLGLAPANPCSDAVFVRRVYLDVIGTLPTAEEARTFLQDRATNKRTVLIDRLLEREEFADYWAMRWSDLLRIKSEFPINLWPNAVQTYHRWVRASIHNNMPYDQFARALLTANGSNFREPPVNFFRAVQRKDPRTLTQAVALTFMGARADKWPAERLTGMTAFFSRVGFKSTAEWKEEIVFFDPSLGTNAPSAVFPDGTTVQIPPDRDPRVVFADWLIQPQNPWFTRNIANRVWAWLMGRGIIHEPDDIRADNPPVNAELLAFLEQELVANHYDLKALYRLILRSRTYQSSSIPQANDPRGEAHFAFYPIRRLEAEVLIDALNGITGTTESYVSRIPEPYTFIPKDQRAIALADASITSPFLELFGRSPRASGLASERNNQPTASQRMHLLNSSHVQRKLEQSATLQALLQDQKGRPREIAEGLYLTILSRYPTRAELDTLTAYRQEYAGLSRVWMDIAWALINSAEFQCRH
ncbi:MAG: DUF1553 domain-containing protein [Kiritimatiellia bacterium]